MVYFQEVLNLVTYFFSCPPNDSIILLLFLFTKAVVLQCKYSRSRIEMRMDYTEWLLANRAMRIRVVQDFIVNGLVKTRSAEHNFYGPSAKTKGSF